MPKYRVVKVERTTYLVTADTEEDAQQIVMDSCEKAYEENYELNLNAEEYKE